MTDTPRASATKFPANSAKYKSEKLVWACACHVDATKPPALSSFEVHVDGVLNPVTSFTVFGAAVISLTLTSTVYAGSVITLAYTAPSVLDDSLDNYAFQQKNGEDYESFSWPVTNEGLPRPEPVTPEVPTVNAGEQATETSPTPTDTSSGAPSWDTEPLTDSEKDSNTVGIFPNPVPGTAIITSEFGFVVGKKNDIKPRIRMKNYAGRIPMTLTASYKENGKTKKYTCKFAPFGTTRKLKSAKWRWYSPKKACILPAALVTSIQSGNSKLSAKATWKRQWFNGKKTQPNGKKITSRKLEIHLDKCASLREISDPPWRALCAPLDQSSLKMQQPLQDLLWVRATANHQHFQGQHHRPHQSPRLQSL
jgi:hypothetical protein